jgi:hypothetical protein
MISSASNVRSGDAPTHGCGTRQVRNEWREVATSYAIVAAVTGTPCAALSVYCWEPWVMLGWLYFVAGFPVLLCAITALWAITVWPFLLLLAAVFGRGKGPKGLNPNGPGVVVCR